MSLIRHCILEMLTNAVTPLLADQSAVFASFSTELEIPKIAEHGDYASNVAMALTRILKRNPREIAQRIVDNLNDPDKLLERTEIAGPGFINFFVSPSAWTMVLKDIMRQAEGYGRQNLGQGQRVQVEFVSANPTGPLHIGHGRGAATGDVIARILDACGYNVEREYYINDAGNQMDTLGRSLYFRYQQLLGNNLDFPEGHYQGEYMVDLAKDFLQEVGDRFRDRSLEEALPAFSGYAGERILRGIREDLQNFGVTFDAWFSEQSLHDDHVVRKTIDELAARGHVYELDGARWFGSTAFGDEKDRVVIRANGVSTYFASDLAYHKNKYDRGFDRVIDIWGADHHGYVPRMLAGVQALGRKREELQIILVQLVNLLRGGKPVAMSTRAGEFVTLREVVDEVGKDAARYIFLTRRSDSQLDFDLETAKLQGNDNPVFYVQYAHARLCSIFAVAEERGMRLDEEASQHLDRLIEPQELALMKLLGEFPEVLANSASHLEPHRIPYYLNELVATFHSYYNHNRIIGDDPDLTRARLYLAAAMRMVLCNALHLLGVSAPEKM
ncbi:MAG TPA: arginine--tRNA ligase [Syntrophobacteraceae bacterium]|nr:arginine--tRNA ligase [Syntrophobacteraceae bacterium]HBZ57226.1 arginine--tRNA ligase [Syntrophobacteraceae bacterium]